MASNFTFAPAGLSRAVTVGGAAPATVSLSVIQLGGGTFVYGASSVRVVNDGTAAVFLQFAANTTVSVTPVTGMKMLSGSVETFGIKGQPVMAAVCASTFTVTLSVAVGEGM